MTSKGVVDRLRVALTRSDRRWHAHADLIELDERHPLAALDELLEELEAGC